MNGAAEADDLLPGFARHRITTAGGHILARTAGTGPPVLLLHGYPQTHVAWHRIAPALAGQFSVVAADLRGYGGSACPPTGDDHRPYAKRTMAAEMVAAMRAFGFGRFAVIGHDRGGRVAYRMAIDRPGAVDRLVVVDIVTTLDHWRAMETPLTHRLHHWPLLAQPAPIPEALIALDHAGWVESRLRRGSRDGSLAAFDPRALAAYRDALADADRLHASCEDHRAGATVDLDDDRADRQSGRRIASPVLAVLASEGSLAGISDPLALWQPWCDDLRGVTVESGHFVPEEAPQALLDAVVPFLSASPRTPAAA